MHIATTDFTIAPDAAATIATVLPNLATDEHSSKRDQSRTQPATGTVRPSKAALVVKLLRSKKGASIEEIKTATGWQAHSVRGFLSGTVRKKLALSLVSRIGRHGERRYYVEPGSEAKA